MPRSGRLFRAHLCLALCAILLSCGDHRVRPNGSVTGSGEGGAESGPPGPVAVEFRVAVPADTPDDARVYIAGDFQGWNPGSADQELARGKDDAWSITLEFDRGREILFKFTRGHWGVVEKGPEGEEIANRYLAVKEAGVYEFTVAAWADNPPPGTSTITGDVREVDIPGFLGGRPVWIYLPPGYDDRPAERYPVLYMLDGQNVFDEATSFAGEWRVDESCEELIEAGEIRPLIVVAVANGGTSRIDEYTPWYDEDRGAGGGGAEHLGAIIDQVMPWVEANYQVLTGPENTGFSGSSLGGLMSLYAAWAYPEIFGRIAALSPSIQWAGEAILSFAGEREKPPVILYADMGTLESGTVHDLDGNGVDDSIDLLRAMKETALDHGFAEGSDLLIVEDEGANHHESFWAARFPGALRFLFPPR